jgi:hypothetical protein
MRAASFATCGVVLGMVAATGCAPGFWSDTGVEAQGSAVVYRSQARAAAAENGVYGATAPTAAVETPTVETPTVEMPAVEVPHANAYEPASRAETGPRAPGVLVLRMPDCCSGPVVVTVACADGEVRELRARDESEAPPPAPYKPWPTEGRRAPSLYHDR